MKERPNDSQPRSPELLAKLRALGDEKSQGLDLYWKWGFCSGWNAALEAAPTRTQGADDALGDRTLAFIDLLNHYDSTMRNVMALPSGRTQEQKDRARLALIKAFENDATPADHISQERDAERYRMVRQGKALVVRVPVKDKHVTYCIGHKPETSFPEAFDAAVDAALKSAPPEKPAGDAEQRLTVALAVTVMKLMRHLPKGHPEFDKSMKLLNDNGFIKTYTLSGKS